MTALVIVSPYQLNRDVWRRVFDNRLDVQVFQECASLFGISPPKPDERRVILLDTPTPDLDLIATYRIGDRISGLLTLLDIYQLDIIVKFLRAGGSGCVGRDESLVNLAQAIIAVGRGELVLPAALSTQVLMLLARDQLHATEARDTLTEREQDVLHLLAQGFTNKAIAQTLLLSVRTIEAHLRNIFEKLDVHSRTEAALWAARNGYAQNE